MFVHLKNGTEFDSLVKKGAILNFYADWAEPCPHMNQVFSSLSNDYLNFTFIEIHAESFPDISERFEISCVPTFILLKGDTIIQTLEGADSSALKQMASKVTKIQIETDSINDLKPMILNPPAHTLDSTPSVQPQVTQEPIETKLKSLIRSHEIMLFIKGTPESPKCGFSRSTIEILNSLKVGYATFNILSDPEVRESLKIYSNWPTFPQIYVKGELIGGLDILKEMVESGEFQTLINLENIETKLLKLINKDRVMLFMKGSPASPKCGFSHRICELLNANNISFSTFDILTDEIVRSELKKFSNWPTYPQLYVKGELVGGLDIVQEMIQNNELQEMLKE